MNSINQPQSVERLIQEEQVASLALDRSNVITALSRDKIPFSNRPSYPDNCGNEYHAECRYLWDRMEDMSRGRLTGLDENSAYTMLRRFAQVFCFGKEKNSSL